MESKDNSHQPNVVPKPKIKSTEAEIELKWRDEGEAPFKGLGLGSVVEGNMAYFLSGDELHVHSFDSSKRRWNLILPQCPHRGGSLAILQGLLTVVGGWPPFGSKATNKLVSFKSNEWIEHFKPMPTSRHRTTTITYQNHLIVAGGISTLQRSDTLDTVEVLNANKKTPVWSTAASLPNPFSTGSMTICGKLLYMLGGEDKDGSCRTVYTCHLSQLLESCQSSTLMGRLRKSVNEEPNVWWYSPDTSTPMYHSTCATVHGQLVAVGGQDDSKGETKTTAVYKYEPFNRSWIVISHMATARSSCNMAIMNTNELLVFGGRGNDIDRAEIAQLSSIELVN